MPDPEALQALAEPFVVAQQTADVIPSCVAAILLGAPDRISEVLTLPLDCEVRPNTEALRAKAHGLRWWPVKGAEPMIKWMIPSMASVVQTAMDRIIRHTRKAREIAKWYENNPGRVYLPQELHYLREKEFITRDDVAKIMGQAT